MTGTDEPSRTPPEPIQAAALRALLDLGRDVAVLDVREQTASDAGHVLGSTNLPRRDLEFRMGDLVPRPSTSVVVVDGGHGDLAGLAAGDLSAVGYRDVRVLDGGIPAWRDAGETVATGNSVPSKDFGELVQHHDRVPTVPPEELHRWLEEGRDLLICDVRTTEEHRRETIPGSIHLPGFELPARVDELAGPDTMVVVHCSGRTRSIIGAASLRLSGRRNVVALENGTMGWMLAGLQPDHDARRPAPEPSEQADVELRQRWRRQARAVGVTFVTPRRAEQMLELGTTLDRTIYLFDVRTRARFDRGHPVGARWAPSGQLVQLTDQYVPVHGAAIVLVCDDTVRSSIAGYWLRRMGHQRVCVIDGGVAAWTLDGLPTTTEHDRPVLGLTDAEAKVRTVDTDRVRTLLSQDASALVVHVGTSTSYAQGHVPGAAWVSATWLERDLAALVEDPASLVVMTDADGVRSLLAAAKAGRAGWTNVEVLAGGLPAWVEAGHEVATGPPAGAEPDDVFLHPIQRGPDAMRAYLDWEVRLGAGYEPATSAPPS